MKELVFLKLGGSVITDKDVANTVRMDRLDAIASEIARALRERSEISLLLGHGSGSFGHHAANKHNTYHGVNTAAEWEGFIEVATRARELNQIVVERLQLAGIRVVPISPLSSIMTENRKIVSWDESIIQECLMKGLVPVIYGDVILDRQMGGTILSTEDLFAWLAARLHPTRVLLAGLEDGVWKDFPARSEKVDVIHPNELQRTNFEVKTSQSIDVTGGMESKVREMCALVASQPNIEVEIFSGAKPRNVYSTLIGKHTGTLISRNGA